MLHACVQKFDVTDTVGNLIFWKLNRALVTYFSSQGLLLLNSSLPHSSNAICNVSSIVADAWLVLTQDAEICAFYMRSGTCRYGVLCKFDHPPLQEAVAKLQAGGKEGEEKEGVEEKKGEEKKEGLSVVLR